MSRTSIIHRRAVAALVVALALSLAWPAGPAGAGPGPVGAGHGPIGIAKMPSPSCYLVKSNGFIVQIVCPPLLVDYPVNIECPPRCGPAFDWGYDPAILSQGVENMVSERIVAGLVALGNAGAAIDPGARATYRSQAMSAFTMAARYSVNTRQVLRQVGLGSTYDNAFDPQPVPWHSWVQAAGEDIAAGMAYLKQYLTAPATFANPWLPLATAKFDEAYAEFSQQQVIFG